MEDKLIIMNTNISEVDVVKSMNNIVSELHQLPNTGKSVKAIAKAVLLTDKKSVDLISEYAISLEKQKLMLPKDKGADVMELSKQLDNYKNSIIIMNSLIESVNNIFTQNEHVELDEPNTLTFLGQVQRAQKLLKHLIEYLSYYILVESRNGEKKKVSYKDLIKSIKAAAA